MYDFIAEYTSECSRATGNNCDIDVDECASSPCQNGATCTESTVEADVSFHAYQCTCVAGFANGVCEYDFIGEFTRECTVMESSAGVCADDDAWRDANDNGCESWGGDASQGLLACALASSLAGPDGRTAADACCACKPVDPDELGGNCDIDVDE